MFVVDDDHGSLHSLSWLINQADKALYAAKEGGRNCTYRHDGETAHRVVADNEGVLPESARQQQNGPRQPEEIEKPAPLPAAIVMKAKSNLPRPEDLAAVSGLPCRTTFYQQVRNRTSEWKRGGPTFSVLLVELNQCEQTVGQHGQQMREAAILQVKGLLAATVREMDVLGHYAPGCFALLLPTAGLADAIRVAERIRLDFFQCSSAPQDEQARLTLNVGVVQAVETDDSISLLKRAEAALKAATRRGGNRVYYHDGECCASITAMLETMENLA